MNAGAASRLRTLLKAKPKLTYVRLNSQTPCPPPPSPGSGATSRGAGLPRHSPVRRRVSVNQGCFGRLFHSQHHARLLAGRGAGIGKPDQAKYTIYRVQPHLKYPTYSGFRGLPGVCSLRLQWLGSSVRFGTGVRMAPNKSMRVVRVPSRAPRIGSRVPSVRVWRFQEAL
jgi:hypothetical protein